MQKQLIMYSKKCISLHTPVCLFLLLAVATVSPAQTFTVGNFGGSDALVFPSVVGNKIVLSGDGNANHTGIGIQGGKLQFYTAGTSGNIIFNAPRISNLGYSYNYEIMRIAGTGNTGINNYNPQARLDVKGNILLRGYNSFESAGIWFSNSDVSANPYFMGMKDDNSIGFYWNGANAGWKLWTNLATGAIGINNGYGEPGAILTTSGETSATNWKAYNDLDFYKLSTEAQESSSYNIANYMAPVDLQGLSVTQYYSKPTKVEVMLNIQAGTTSCVLCNATDVQLSVMVDGSTWKNFRHYVSNGTTSTLGGIAFVDLPAGTHLIGVQVQNLAGPDLQLTAEAGRKSSMILLAAPSQ